MIVTALVVTFNRRAILERCLSALQSQSRLPDRILVVDNASTDGTQQWLKDWVDQVHEADAVFLATNFGGAGGFAKGIQAALDRDANWIWLVDDDSEPHSDALFHLTAIANDPGHIYGPLFTSDDNTAWPTTLVDYGSRTVERVADVPAIARVAWLPYCFMIHRQLVNRIGLPDSEFFITASDIEYCYRARRSGADIILVGNSHIEHPKPQQYQVRLPWRSVTCLSLPPWKRYYDTRNRILIAHEYYGLRLLVTSTVPGSLIRLLGSLRYDTRKAAQLWAFCAGFIDGLLKFKGMRHKKWHIR